MGSDGKNHILMVSFPGRGHVNPLLRLAKRLASEGLFITFSTTRTTAQTMLNTAANSPNKVTKIGKGHIRFEFFSDGWEKAEDQNKYYDLTALMNQLETVGRDNFTQLLKHQFESGRPVSCIINNPFIPWVTDVASDMGIPSAVLWVQSCAVFSAYYHFFHNLASFPTIDQPSLSVTLPGLPVLDSDEIPSFLHPSSCYKMLEKAILGQFKNLSKASCVLVDSFQELENEVLDPLVKLSPIKPIGPLFNYRKEETEEETKEQTGDLPNDRDECIEWLDKQPLSSVVYVSFGTIVAIKNQHMKEIAIGLLNSGVRFVWVVREQPKGVERYQDFGELPDGFVQETEGKGLVVPWCKQDQVLAHPSVACFMTHCGWNSSMESLSCGVPVVTFPQWGDQVTNGKFLVDVFGVGVRLIRSENDLKTLSSEDVEKCLVEVMRGPKAEEMKKNALKWKKDAMEAVAPGGSSDRNIHEFVNEVQGIGAN